MSRATPLTERVIVLAPLGRDAAVISRALAEAGIACTIVRSIVDFTAAVRHCPGAALVTEEALTAEGVARLAETLARQPSWSDLPVLLLLAEGERLVPEAARPVERLRKAGNVTVLVRPVPAVALVTAVQAALRARHRQYEVWDLIRREQAARRQAETAMQLKDEFLGTISHELRTPLSAVLLWTRLLASGRVEPEKTQEALQLIECSAKAQSGLIEDLLDMSRAFSGRLRLNITETEIGTIAQQAVAVVQPTAEARDVQLQTTIDPAAGRVRVDPERLQQVIWNLLSNAIKFTPAAGCVTLQLCRQGDEVLVRVSDTGEGISPEFLPHVFERFRQADAATTRRHGGLGLGLAITRQLVELQGGSITAHSEGPGKGAVFLVRLPLRRCSGPPGTPR